MSIRPTQQTTKRIISHTLASLAACLLLTTPAMAWVSVGSSPGFGTCTYATISEALADGDNEIRILNNQTFAENLLITGTRTLRGGFTSCLAAGLDIQIGTNTEIDGSDSAILPTIAITSSSGTVTLENLTITGGAVGVATGSLAGVLNVRNSSIVGNSGGLDGAGLSIGNPGDTLQVVIRESSIRGNSTSGDGGGIWCNDPDGSIRLESGAIFENSAAGNGGGVFVGSGCRFSSFAGSRIEDGSELRGIVSNSAGDLGGGVYAEGGAQVEINGHLGPLGLWGNTTDPATVANNLADLGGGLYATGTDTLVEMIDAVIRDNEAVNRGGGARIRNGSELRVDVSGADCWNGFRCSQWRDNRVSGGGIEYGGHLSVQDARAQIDRTHLTGGRAELGTAIYARGSETTIHLEGSYLSGNGASFPPISPEEYVVRLFGGADATLLHVTVANNLSTGAALGVSGSGSTLSATNSIISNASIPVVETESDGQASFDCVVANEASSTGSGVAVADPEFRSPSAGDFRLGLDSPAIDRCADAGATVPDDEGQARGIDESSVINLAGTFDTGADEYLIIDSLFSDRFEDD